MYVYAAHLIFALQRASSGLIQFHMRNQLVHWSWMRGMWLIMICIHVYYREWVSHSQNSSSQHSFGVKKEKIVCGKLSMRHLCTEMRSVGLDWKDKCSHMKSEQRLAFVVLVAAFLPVTRAGVCAACGAVVCVSPRLRLSVFVYKHTYMCIHLHIPPPIFPFPSPCKVSGHIGTNG